MKILMLEWKSFGNEDIISAFKELGHDVKTIPFSKDELHHDDTEEAKHSFPTTESHLFSKNIFQ